jgi:hypothetical protein
MQISKSLGILEEDKCFLKRKSRVIRKYQGSWGELGWEKLLLHKMIGLAQ